MIYIKNAKAVLEDSILDNAVLQIKDDRIVKVGTEESIPIPSGTPCIDAEGAYIGPGFVDIHVHGGNGTMFFEAPTQTAKHFLMHGETTVLPTLYYDLPKAEFLEAIARIQSAMKSPGGESIAGFYMEGPYMNPKYGACADKNCWSGEIRLQDYHELVDRAGSDAKVWAVAPEREGIGDFVKYAKEVYPGAAISVGHSEANPDQIAALKPYGLALQTHCMNATGQNSDWLGTRGCGPDEACLLDDDMYAEIISDSMGIHINPHLQKLILKVKGTDKVILVTDSFAGDGEPPENLSHVTDLTFDSNGNLCGSRLTMDAAVRNVMKHTGCSIVQAFRMASYNPARAIGMEEEIGSISPGKKANLVFLDSDLQIKKVMLNGIVQ